MLRTIKRVAITQRSQVVVFEEGPALTTDYEVAGQFVDAGGYVIPFNPDTMVTSKTVIGFTLVTAVNGYFAAIVSEYGTASVIKTVARVAFTAPTQVVAFEDGPAPSADYEVVGTFIDGSGDVVAFDQDTMVSLKTVNGFTLTVGVNGFFSAIASGAWTGGTDSTTNIVTLALVKEYLNITDGLSDTFLSRWIGIISDCMEKETNSIIVARNFTGTIENGSGSKILQLHQFPVISLANSAVTDIQYRTEPTGTWTDILDDTDNALIDAFNPTQIELYGSTFPKGRQNIKLNLRLGYSPIPQRLVQICIEAVAEIWQQSNHGNEGARLGVQSRANSGTAFSGTTTYYELTARHKAMLNAYRYSVL